MKKNVFLLYTYIAHKLKMCKNSSLKTGYETMSINSFREFDPGSG